MIVVELWKDIEGYEGLYQISNLGRVKSLPKLRGRSISEEKILRNKINKRGYHQVCLCKDKNTRKYPYVHRLTANAFLEKLNDTFEVNHIDGDKNNNCVKNLEWSSHKSNIIHGWNNGLMENVRNSTVEKLGFKCRLIRIKDHEIFEFKTHKGVSKFLGFDEQWLSNSIRQCSNYTNVCKEKGYIIELNQERKESNKRKIKFKLKNINTNEEYIFYSKYELCKFFNRSGGWMNYLKQVNKFENELLKLGFKLEEM